jgi:Uma2 family endonuclease
MPKIAPELAIEVLSKGNTRAEMTRKRAEYFKIGVDFVWEVDPWKRSVRVYTRGQERSVVFHDSQTIEPGKTLKGLRLVLADLFGELDAVQARLPDSMKGI